MPPDIQPGRLIDALTGHTVDAPAINDRIRRRTAMFAALGLRPGDRALLHYGNRPEFFIDLLAIWSAGACAVPLDPRATPTELGNICDAARPRLSVWHDSPGADAAAAITAAGARILDATTNSDPVIGRERPPSWRPEDEALILFTSGTTGQPKGVVHTHRSLQARWQALRENLGTTAFERTLCLLPTHFGHGLICNSLYPWLSGQSLFIMPPFRADLLLGLGEIIDRHGITFLSSVPPVWRIALKMTRPPARATLRRVFCGSAPLSRHLWEGIRDWAGTAEVCNAYGITETGSWIAGTTVAGVAPEDGLIGPGWGTVIRILRQGDTLASPESREACAPGEEGYVWLKTPGLMRGYLGRDDLTAEVVCQGWFSTGDIGALDDRGLLYLRGRQREEINKGGMKIYPADVDAVIEQHPGVLDVCTYGYEHPLYGEDVAVAVVMQNPDAAQLRDLCQWTLIRLGEHRLPGRWHLLDEIPRSSRGKLNRAMVAAACAALEPADPRRG